MTFLIESIIACALFTLFVFGVLLGLLVRYINHCETFWCGVKTSYALWNVVNWFDCSHVSLNKNN